MCQWRAPPAPRVSARLELRAVQGSPSHQAQSVSPAETPLPSHLELLSLSGSGGPCVLGPEQIPCSQP